MKIWGHFLLKILKNHEFLTPGTFTGGLVPPPIAAESCGAGGLGSIPTRTQSLKMMSTNGGTRGGSEKISITMGMTRNSCRSSRNSSASQLIYNAQHQKQLASDVNIILNK